MASAQGAWRYQPCTACEAAVCGMFQQAQIDWTVARISCADGQDGLCAQHRAAVEWECMRPERERRLQEETLAREVRREARRKARWMRQWTAAVLEGQE